VLRKNHYSTSDKVYAGMASFILALTCMPGFTILARTLTTASLSDQMSKQENKSAGAERTAEWKDDHGRGSLHAKKVELTADGKDVKAIGKDGYLVIDETRDGVRRRLKIEPADDGKLKRTYSVDGVTQEMDEIGKAWLARILHDSITSIKVMKP
jgi:hypothetical protein